jgi:hypothetical protein
MIGGQASLGYRARQRDTGLEPFRAGCRMGVDRVHVGDCRACVGCAVCVHGSAQAGRMEEAGFGGSGLATGDLPSHFAPLSVAIRS